MYDLAQIRSEAWNNRLRNLIIQSGLTQSELVAAINEKYNTSFGQKDVSRWINVGHTQKNGTIGFPKYDTMMIIADFFSVDCGFLTGETDLDKFDLPKAAIFLGLEMDTIKEIRSMTRPETKDPSSYTLAMRKIIDRLLSSNLLTDLLLNVYSLYSFSPVSGVPDNNKFDDVDIAESFANDANNSIGLYRYKVWESFFKMLDELYPYAKTEDYLKDDWK